MIQFPFQASAQVWGLRIIAFHLRALQVRVRLQAEAPAVAARISSRFAPRPAADRLAMIPGQETNWVIACFQLGSAFQRILVTRL